MPPEYIRMWDISAAVAGASIVHVCRPYTRAGEISVLAAKGLGKPLTVSDLEADTSGLGRSFQMLDLADAIIVHSAEEGGRYLGPGDVVILDVKADGWLPLLGDVYRGLLPGLVAR